MMPSLATLPAEILLRIVSLIDDRGSVANVRLANHQFDNIAVGELFSTATLYAHWATHDDNDGEVTPPGPLGYNSHSFINIVEHERLNPLVKAVVVYYCETHCNHSQELAGEEHDGWWPDPLMDSAWHKALSVIPQLSNLRGITLCFDRHAGEGEDWNPVFFTASNRTDALMNIIDRGLLDDSISELAIRHYDGCQGDLNGETTWIEALERLTSLRVSVSQEEPKMQHDPIYAHGELHDAWESFPALFLEPCQKNLQRLVLYSDVPVGWYPKMDLRDIHFPNLRSLSLGYFLFSHEWQFDFITSHHTTLQELYLDNCALLYQIGLQKGDRLDEEGFPLRVFRDKGTNGTGSYFHSYDLRWFDVFPRFANELECLRDFRFGMSEEWRFDTESQYQSTGDVYEAQPIMPWNAEHKICNEIYSERYLHYDGFAQNYRSAWDHDEYSERNQYVPEMLDKIKESPSPSCNQEDAAALRALLEKLGLCGNVKTSCSRAQMRKRLRCFDHRVRDWDYDEDEENITEE